MRRKQPSEHANSQGRQKVQLKVGIIEWQLLRRHLLRRFLRDCSQTHRQTMLCAKGVKEDRSHLFFMHPFAQVIWASYEISWVEEVTSDEAFWGLLRYDVLRRKMEWGKVLMVYGQFGYTIISEFLR